MNTVTKLYRTDIAFEIDPVWKEIAPRVRVWLDEHVIWHGEILDVQPFTIAHPFSNGTHSIAIELHDKPNIEAYQAIRIQNLRMGNISSPRFIWQGRYRPIYPEPWATQQRDQGNDLLEEIKNTDYLGWNGIWRLEFTVPVFTWIHQVENLGWIYD